MTYAPATRAFYDADSHIMELPDFLQKYADPALRDEIPEVSYSASIVTDEEVAVIVGQGGRHSPEHVAAQVALGDKLIESSKEIQALGAFDSKERSQALDMLGFKKQLVFATHSVRMPFSPSSKIEPNVRYGGARAHNRHMADFVGADDRLMGVAIVPMDEPDLALEEAKWAIDHGLEAIWVPHRPCGDRSPGHVEFEPFWDLLAQSGTPFVLHVGGSPLQLTKAWGNTGRAPTRDWLGGGENLRTKDIALLHEGPEQFLTMLVLDGVLERHPTLKGAVIELGAGWVPDMIRRLDHAAAIWARSEPHLAVMTRRPSEQIRAQLRFTPYPFEDVGAFVRESWPELYLFSSDYPHAEGGRDPIGRFERTLEGADEAVKRRFYADNFATLYPDTVTV